MRKTAIVKVQRGGRIQIPLDIRKELGINEKDIIRVSFEIVLKNQDENVIKNDNQKKQ